MVGDAVADYDQDVSMTDLSTDSEDPTFYSMKDVMTVNILTDSDDDDIPWYTMKDIFEQTVGMVTRRPRLKMMTGDQKAAYLEKYGSDGDALRKTVCSKKITKITKITKVNY